MSYQTSARTMVKVTSTHYRYKQYCTTAEYINSDQNAIRTGLGSGLPCTADHDIP